MRKEDIAEMVYHQFYDRSDGEDLRLEQHGSNVFLVFKEKSFWIEIHDIEEIVAKRKKP